MTKPTFQLTKEHFLSGRSILNGVIGDYLNQQGSSLSVPMSLHATSEFSQPEQLDISNHLVIFLHGLTNTENIWRLANSNDDYGRRLQQHFGYTPLYLRYNTGLGLDENGIAFAELMESVIERYPIELSQITLVGFSMGGLISRIAQAHASQKNHQWISKFTNGFYIGTPHAGSPLEKLGSLATQAISRFPKPYIHQWADWANIRSEGIQNLKHGLKQSPIDYHPQANHHFISGGLSKEPSNKTSWLTKVAGDSLVRRSSAQPKDAPSNSKHQHFEHIAHLPLAYSEEVYRQLHCWFSELEMSAEITQYSVARETLTFLNHDQAETEHSTSEVISDSIDLVKTGIDQTLNTVEKTHLEIAKEPFSILNRIPVVGPVAQTVDTIHSAISRGVYSSIRQATQLADTASKQAVKLVK